MGRKTILVIDDEKEIAELARVTLESEGFDVLVANDGTSGLEIAERHSPDAMVVDIRMPDVDGLEVCRRVRSLPMTAAMPIIMLTAVAGEEDRVNGFEIGADDYLTKPFSPRELAARVKALIRRATIHEQMPSVLRQGDLTVDTTTHSVNYAGREVDLTATEFRILLHLATHPGAVLSREEIIRHVRDEDAAVLDRSIDVHILSLRRKLLGGKEIQTVRGFGYKFSLAA
ncbi:MAG TPA: response regulator transcription factor [Tepidisphaeraceae bacterium]|nr:response regulator transcription factor [Tepidisphaeraceae bacterium]